MLYNNETMETNLKTIKSNLSSGQYINSIFDPVQTHAIYGLKSKAELNEMKLFIKSNNLGNKFRQVKNSFGVYTLCVKVFETENK